MTLVSVPAVSVMVLERRLSMACVNFSWAVAATLVSSKVLSWRVSRALILVLRSSMRTVCNRYN